MAETQTIQFELVSPSRLLKSGPVEMVVVPGAEGDIGVLPGHSPLIASLRVGTIDIHSQGKVEERIFVAGGFCEVSPERCTVLAEEAEPIADIDRGRVDSRLAAAKKALDDAVIADDAIETAKATAEIATCEALLALISG